MSNLNDKIKSISKNTTQKVKQSEMIDKVKTTANDVTQKIKDNENVAEAMDKLNQNEYVKKVQASKYAKLIKIGLSVVAILLIIGIFSLIFGRSLNDKEAIAAMEKYMQTVDYDPNMIKNDISVKSVDSYKAKTTSGKSVEVFVLDIQYTVGGKTFKEIRSAYKEDGKEFVCALLSKYDDGTNTRSEAIKSIKNDLKKMFK